MKIFATTYPKNMYNISFDRDLSILSQKIIITKFGHMITEILIFKVRVIKSYRNL